MSAPDDDENPWLSLFDLLLCGKEPISAGVLATSIEKEGIQGYDRFGRRTSTTSNGPECEGVKESALNLLAWYYKNVTDSLTGGEFARQLSEDYESPLMLFGWPKDESPDFKKYKSETPPQFGGSISRLNNELRSDAEGTYLVLLDALCKKAGLDIRERGMPKRIGGIVYELGVSLSDEKIRLILKKIPDAIDFRQT
jgi:hypothetical protein